MSKSMEPFGYVTVIVVVDAMWSLNIWYAIVRVIAGVSRQSEGNNMQKKWLGFVRIIAVLGSVRSLTSLRWKIMISSCNTGTFLALSAEKRMGVFSILLR